MVNNARLFVELIRKASGDCYPSWAPSHAIEVGDYGVINSETAEFDRQGNIYDPGFAPELEIAKLHPHELCATEDQLVIVSRGCKGRSLDADLNVQFPELVNSNIKGRWEFQRGTGAILVLFKPAESRIRDKAILLEKLQYNEVLAEKALVTSVYKCPMYALLLTADKHGKADAAIGLSIANVGTSSLRGKWHCHSTSGVWRTAGEDGNSTFRPLYTLRTPKTRTFMERLMKRRAEVKPTGEMTFHAYQPPWGRLDDEGEELPPEVSDDDEEDESKA
ncbi:hypothetical protein NM688_g3160 [Phlebia brevispora]|uniref:Uncharacterized protein n=1 Tax=Phlebia brevispora TaxID=194682 RepID=A0ACC1T6R0_9APHY|nr:hypothetical protein NM688_g3160 [Phlebia brevispora]